jgi:GNAT superfamily N-acetyltransferase
MNENIPYHLIKLGAAEVLYFHNLLLSRYYETLLNDFVEGKGVFWGCYKENQPAGLLYTRKISDHTWDLVYSYVTETLREQGIATAMIRQLSECAQKEEVSRIYTLLNEKTAPSLILRKIYEKNKWIQTGYARELFYLILNNGSIENLLNTWKQTFGNFVEFPNNFSFIPLKYLSIESYEWFYREKGKCFPEGFFPFRYQTHYEHIAHDNRASTVVLYKEKPVGWIIYRLLRNRQYMIDSLYVLEEYRYKNLFLPLLSESAKRIEPDVKYIYFYVNRDNTNMLKLLRIIETLTIKRETAIEFMKETKSF